MNEEQQLIYKKLISKYKFNIFQKCQIEMGLKNNVDVSIYANPEFT